MSDNYIPDSEDVRTGLTSNLQRYKPGFSFTKELLQNADDAPAESLLCGVSDAMSAFGDIHPLFHKKGMFILNDGKFDIKDQKSIKGFKSRKFNEEDSIGRFGLGLKSIYHFCDAFFFLSSSHCKDSDLGELGFINPWDRVHEDETNLFHKDWGDFDRSKVAEKIRNFVLDRTEDQFSEWFLIWVPLRHRNYDSDPKKVISNKFYLKDDDSNEILIEKIFGDEIRWQLPSSISFLEHLRNFSIYNLDEKIVEIKKEFGEWVSKRKEGCTSLSGEIDLEYKDNTNSFLLSGKQNFIEERNLPESLQSIKNHEDWPAHDGNPKKAKAHAGFLFLRPKTDSKIQEIDAVSVRRCSFLPLSEDEGFFGKKESSNYLELLLHGYYFCDDGRNKADLDENEISGRWNRKLAEELTAPQLLPEFTQILNDSSLAKKTALKLCKSLAEAANTFFEIEFGIKIYALVLKVNSSKETSFESITRSDSEFFLPLKIQEKNLAKLFDIAPGLSTLIKQKHKTVYLEREAFIFSEGDAIQNWDKDSLNILLDEKFKILLDDGDNFETLIDFLHGINNSNNKTVLAPALQKAILRLYKEDGIPENSLFPNLRKVSEFCDQENLVYADFSKFSSKSGKSLFLHMASVQENFICIPTGEGNENTVGSSQIALDVLNSWSLENEGDRNKASDLARSILSSIQFEEKKLVLKNYRFLPIIKYENGVEEESFASLNELEEFSLSKKLFEQKELIKLFGQALRDKTIYLFKKSFSEDYGLGRNVVFAEVACYVQEEMPVLVDSESRKDLVCSAISSMQHDEFYKEIVRFFIHGNAHSFDDFELPLYAPDSGTWFEVAKAFLSERSEQWRVLPDVLLCNLNNVQYQQFGIERMTVESIARLLLGDLDLVKSLEFEGLEPKQIRDMYKAEHLLTEILLKALPIHLTTNNTNESIHSQTYLEGGWPLPQGIISNFSLLETPEDSQVLEILKRIAPPITKELVLEELLVPPSGKSSDYTEEIFKIIKKLPYPIDDDLYRKIKTTCWNINTNDEEISLSKVMHPKYSGVASKILNEARGNSEFLLSRSVKIPSRIKRNDRETKEFKNQIKKFCLHKKETLNALGKLCRDEKMVLGITEDVYKDLNESEKKSFFEFSLKKVESILSQNLPLVGLLKECFPDEISIREIEDFLFPNGTEQENLLGVTTPDKTKHLLDRLAVECERTNNTESFLNEYILFLRSAVVELGCFQDEILSELKFLSMDGIWRDSSMLCLSCESVSKEFQLHSKIEQILCEICPSPGLFGESQSISEEDILENYFTNWLSKVPPPIIGGFISFLGDETCSASNLASHYLENNGTTNDIRKELLGMDENEINELFGDTKITLSIANPESMSVYALTGTRIPVTQEEILIPTSIGYFIPNPTNSDEHTEELQLNKFSVENLEQEVLVAALRNTWIKILQSILSRRRWDPFSNDQKLDDLINKLSEISRIEIHVAQQIALRKAFQFLESKNLPEHSVLGKMAREFDDCLRKKCHDLKSVDEQIKRNANRNFEQTENELLSNLSETLEYELIEGDEEEKILLDEIRKSVRDECQYRESSIPFEIFQNADDALLQLERTDLAFSEFRIIVNENKLFFLHWGRPINSWRGTGLGRDAAQRRKYDQDLDKMLFLHGSAKRMKENGETTGKFGVGFKSVYLLCDRPKIVSDKIDFEIVAGFYPKRLEDDIKLALENTFSKTEKGGTALLLQGESNERVKESLSEFKRCIHFLPLFAKAVTKIRIEDDQISEFKLKQIDADHGKYFKIVTVQKDGDDEEEVAVFNFGENKAKLVLKEEGSAFGNFDKTLPTFWVTVPTEEKLRLGFFINGPFKLDIGRAKIHRELETNFGVITGFRHDFWRGLEDMWDHFEKIEQGESYERWLSLWNLFGRKFSIRFKDNPEEVGTRLLKELLWGEGNSPQGYHKFIQRNTALPNGLKEFPSLLKLKDIEWKCSDFFENLILEKIVSWQSVKGLKKNLISSSTFNILNDLAWESVDETKEFGLFELFKRDDVFLELKIENSDANRLGGVFNEEILSKYEDVNSNEIVELKKKFKDVKFKSANGDWLKPKLLLIRNEQENTNQEYLISKFSPEGYLLDESYLGMENAISFFNVCRGDFKCPDDEELIEWAKNFKEDNHKEGFCLFLLSNSNAANAICEKYREEDDVNFIDWMHPLKLKRFLRSCDSIEEHEKSQILAKLGITTLEIEESEWEEEVELPTNQDAKTELRELLSDFRQNKKQIIQNYEKVIYPDGRSPILPDNWEETREDTDARKEWLKIFIVSLTYRFGRAHPESARNFLAECEREGRLEKFANRHTMPHEWMDLLDDMIDHQEENDQRYFWWLSNFPVFYKISKYLDVYVRIFHGMLYQEFYDIDDITNPRRNIDLEGWGIIAPGFRKDLGMGIHFVLSEFARIKDVENPSFHKLCYLPKKSMRDYLSALGCQGLSEHGYESGDSERIHQYLVSQLGEYDATFDNCFHLPLFMRADNRYSEIFIAEY